LKKKPNPAFLRPKNWLIQPNVALTSMAHVAKMGENTIVKGTNHPKRRASGGGGGVTTGQKSELRGFLKHPGRRGPRWLWGARLLQQRRRCKEAMLLLSDQQLPCPLK